MMIKYQWRRGNRFGCGTVDLATGLICEWPDDQPAKSEIVGEVTTVADFETWVENYTDEFLRIG